MKRGKNNISRKSRLHTNKLTNSQSQLDSEIRFILYGEHNDDNWDKVTRLKRMLNAVIEGELTETQRTYIKMYYFNDISQPEIAELFNVSPQSVNRCIKSGLQAIKKILKYYLIFM